jgi:hypothetical protein
LEDTKVPTQVDREAQTHEYSKTSNQKEETTAKASPSSAPLAATDGACGDGQPSQSAQESPPGKKKEK